ncbi:MULTISPECIES: GyrI-like domain-containing protein [unclassified Fusibacter]|uniref:MerR family transcriptional regulator n=1 Tax=unclassified Fusibacter TaxID=2624464 RepID=UPI0010131C34|nr:MULTISPECIES: GyrI-like domain-containing protein [unclassified Fusibacter]MCK8058348.1 MerR family transcriptional regulator [Fusibacter sp. A2]NPE20931.1 MerR family transcriptional regulator [Fusibacter sp. A1]RXV63134.1 MerR family transcriptional regulator [Fusibacter sp. A1]
MKDKFLIGEMAKLFNISTDTLRHYDRMDILKPEIDSQNDYRYYSIRSLFTLSRILFFKNLDISLSDIRGYMRQKNTLNLMSLLKKKDEELDEKIHRLLNLKMKIQNKLSLLDNVKEMDGKIQVRHLNERYGTFLTIEDLSNEVEIKEAFKEARQFMKISSWLIEGQIYTSISQETIEQGIFNKYRYFIEVVMLESSSLDGLVVMPASDYACTTFIGPYSDMSKHYQTLVDWINENGYKVAGDSIEKNIVDYDFADSENEFVTEIQIPIAKK